MLKALSDLVNKSFNTLDALLDSADPKIQLSAVKEALDYDYKLLRLEYNGYEPEHEEMDDSEKVKYQAWKQDWNEKYMIPMSEFEKRSNK